MLAPRAGHTTTVTTNENFLVVGGEGGAPGGGATSVEILNTDSFTFFQAAPMAKPRTDHVAFPIGGGKVLVSGGNGGMANAEIFNGGNPGAWAPAPMPPASHTMAVALPVAINGLGEGFVVSGGTQGNIQTESAGIFALGKWNIPSPMMFQRAGHAGAAFAPPLQQTIVTGGIPGPTTSAEIFPACEGDTDCPLDHYCSKDGLCRPFRDQLGMACQNLGAADCKVSGCHICGDNFCVDGVCCNVPADQCDGQCEACDGPNPGQCEPIEGPPHGKLREPCVGSEVESNEVCAGRCDGFNRNVCHYPAGVQCEAGCDESGVVKKSCDGKGYCSQIFTTPCGAFKCDPTTATCVTGCKTNDDCSENSVCNVMTGLCVLLPTSCKDDGQTVILENGTEKSCAPYGCDDVTGQCRVVCDSAYDCAKGFICDENSKCIAWSQEDTITQNVNGCACALPGADERTRPEALLALAGLGLLAARRRDRARSSR